MSDAGGQTSCLQHRAGSRYFIYYQDYQDIAPKQHADKIAAFLRVLEVKTNKQDIAQQERVEEAQQKGLPTPAESRWLEITYNDFVQYSLQTVGRSSFQIAEKEAEKLLFSKSRVVKRPSRANDPQSPRVAVKEYVLVRENVQAAIDGRELPIVGDLFEQYPEIPPVKNTRGTAGIITSPVKNNTTPAKNERWAVENNRGGLLFSTEGAVVFNRYKNKSNRINQIKGKEKEAAPPSEHSSDPSETAALTAAISLLKNFSKDQVLQVFQALEHADPLEETPSTESLPPSQQGSDVLENMPPAAPAIQAKSIKDVLEEILPAAPASPPQQASAMREEKTSANQEAAQDQPVEPEPIALEKPAPDAPRRAETVLALVEFLRDQRYTPEQRTRQLRAAQRLLMIQPELSLAEIEEAWWHGSDDYWLETHNGEDVHVHDLVSQDSHGQYRVLAFLAHKRAQERRASSQSRSGAPSGSRSSCGRRGGSAPSKPFVKPPKQPTPPSTLSEEQAHALVEQMAQQAAEHHYTLHGTPEREGEGWMVRVTWTSSAWRRELKFAIRSCKQWESELREWQEILHMHERKQKGA